MPFMRAPFELVSDQGRARLFVPVVRPSPAPHGRYAVRTDPHPFAALVLCHPPVHHDPPRRFGQGIGAPARRDVQDRVAHGEADPRAHGGR